MLLLAAGNSSPQPAPNEWDLSSCTNPPWCQYLVPKRWYGVMLWCKSTTGVALFSLQYSYIQYICVLLLCVNKCDCCLCLLDFWETQSPRPWERGDHECQTTESRQREIQGEWIYLRVVSCFNKTSFVLCVLWKFGYVPVSYFLQYFIEIGTRGSQLSNFYQVRW